MGRRTSRASTQAACELALMLREFYQEFEDTERKVQVRVCSGAAVTRIAEDVTELTVVAQWMHQMAEHECNYGLTDRQQRARDASEARWISAFAHRYPALRLEFNGDPRGFAITIYGLNRSNSFAGAGWGVG